VLEVIRFKARLIAGRAYATAFAMGGALLRAIVPPQSPLGRFKRWLATRLRPRWKRKLALLLAAFARAYPEARFAQIGANDGMLQDPLREFILRHRWRGVLAEPLPHLFARLKENYADRPGLTFENVAISSAEGPKTFYSLTQRDELAALPPWAGGLGSFSRDILLSHETRIPGIARYILEQQVQVISFDALCRKARLDNLDLLQIDAEGHDAEILESIDLRRWQPRLLIYEHHHLTAAQQQACLSRLARFGYRCMQEGLDTFCLRSEDASDRDRPLLALWDALAATARVPL